MKVYKVDCKTHGQEMFTAEDYESAVKRIAGWKGCEISVKLLADTLREVTFKKYNFLDKDM